MATFIFLTTGSNATFNVPADWNNFNNTIEVIGGGGGGSSSVLAGSTGAGGGGAAYAKITNLTLTPSGTATYTIGAGGGIATTGGDSWFNGTTLGGSSCGAKGGGGASGATFGAGGLASASIGTTKFDGGSGGVQTNTFNGGSGGGGGAGPGGIGRAGGPCGGNSHGYSEDPGAGGGGNGGGTDGLVPPNFTSGGNGGASVNATAGGVGGGANTVGSVGAQGSGGGGGGSTQTASASGAGGNGGNGVDTGDGTKGSGGGGGGGGGSLPSAATGAGGNGGAGGLYGGGGGGGGWTGGTIVGAGGAGAGGLIVVTYTAAAAPSNATPDYLGVVVGDPMPVRLPRQGASISARVTTPAVVVTTPTRFFEPTIQEDRPRQRDYRAALAATTQPVGPKARPTDPCQSMVSNSGFETGALSPFTANLGSNAISAINLTANGNTSSLSSYTTASITPTANNLILVSVASNSVSATANIPTVTGAGGTWVLVGSSIDGGNIRRVSIFRDLTASPGSGILTIDFAGQAQNNCHWSVDQFSNTDTSGTHGSGAIVQAVSGTQASTPSTGFSLSLAPLGSPSNAAFGYIRNNSANTINPGTGFTELSEVMTSVEAEYGINQTNVSWTWASQSPDIVAEALEIKAGAVVTATVTSTGPHTGTYAGRLAATAGGAFSDIEQIVAVAQSTDYTASVWVCSHNTSTTGTFTIYNSDLSSACAAGPFDNRDTLGDPTGTGQLGVVNSSDALGLANGTDTLRVFQTASLYTKYQVFFNSGTNTSVIISAGYVPVIDSYIQVDDFYLAPVICDPPAPVGFEQEVEGALPLRKDYRAALMPFKVGVTRIPPAGFVTPSTFFEFTAGNVDRFSVYDRTALNATTRPVKPSAEPLAVVSTIWFDLTIEDQRPRQRDYRSALAATTWPAAPIFIPPENQPPDPGVGVSRRKRGYWPALYATTSPVKPVTFPPIALTPSDYFDMTVQEDVPRRADYRVAINDSTTVITLSVPALPAQTPNIWFDTPDQPSPKKKDDRGVYADGRARGWLRQATGFCAQWDQSQWDLYNWCDPVTVTTEFFKSPDQGLPRVPDRRALESTTHPVGQLTGNFLPLATPQRLFYSPDQPLPAAKNYTRALSPTTSVGPFLLPTMTPDYLGVVVDDPLPFRPGRIGLTYSAVGPFVQPVVALTPTALASVVTPAPVRPNYQPALASTSEVSRRPISPPGAAPGDVTLISLPESVNPRTNANYQAALIASARTVSPPLFITAITPSIFYDPPDQGLPIRLDYSRAIEATTHPVKPLTPEVTILTPTILFESPDQPTPQARNYRAALDTHPYWPVTGDFLPPQPVACGFWDTAKWDIQSWCDTTTSTIFFDPPDSPVPLTRNYSRALESTTHPIWPVTGNFLPALAATPSRWYDPPDQPLPARRDYRAILYRSSNVTTTINLTPGGCAKWGVGLWDFNQWCIADLTTVLFASPVAAQRISPNYWTAIASTSAVTGPHKAVAASPPPSPPPPPPPPTPDVCVTNFVVDSAGIVTPYIPGTPDGAVALTPDSTTTVPFDPNPECP